MHSLHMGWLRSVGSIRLQVSFAEYRLLYRALLQKRPTIFNRSYQSKPPHMCNAQRLTCVFFFNEYIYTHLQIQQMCVYMCVNVQCTGPTPPHTRLHTDTHIHIHTHTWRECMSDMRMGLFKEEIGLFWEDVGLFWEKMGLFCIRMSA